MRGYGIMAQERLNAKRTGVLEILEAFLQNITGKPLPKIDSAVVDRAAGFETGENPRAALRKSN